MNAILIGRLLKPHGLKGQVKASFYIDDFSDIKNFTAFYRQDKLSPTGYKKLNFLDINIAGGNIAVTIDGCSDRTVAEAYKGIDLFVSEDELPQLKEDLFYIKDLENCTVDVDGTDIGSVRSVFEAAGRNLLLVKLTDKGDTAIPFNDKYVEKVNIKEKRVTLRNIEELL